MKKLKTTVCFGTIALSLLCSLSANADDYNISAEEKRVLYYNHCIDTGQLLGGAQRCCDHLSDADAHKYGVCGGGGNGGGFIANVLNKAGLITEQQRRQLDDQHKAAGQPIDQTFEAVLDYYAPGAGRARQVYRSQ
jgi:hypothetical protein